MTGFSALLQVLILKNHGIVLCGSTVEETYLLLDFFSLACKSQVAMMAAGEENLVQVPSTAFQNMLKVMHNWCAVLVGLPCEIAAGGF